MLSVTPNFGSQGSTVSLQGSSPSLQGSTYNPQTTVNPQNIATFTQPQLSGINLVPPTPVVAPTPAPPTPNSIAGTPGYVAPPKLDFAAIQAQSRAAAENAVNPYYTKTLNDFLAQQAYNKQQRQAQYDTNINTLQTNLENTLKANEVNKQRTAEDVAKNQQDINTQADWFQTDTGKAFAASRLKLAEQNAQSGLTGGLANQATSNAQATRNTAETRQEQQFQQHRVAQELFKTRTFEDIARSGDLATQGAEKGKAQEKFNLDNFIKNSAFDEAAQRNQLEQQRLAAIQSEQQNQAKLAFNQYLAKITNPIQYESAVKTYGGAF